VLQARIDGDFEHISYAADFGMMMASALDVLADESFTAYQAFHREWPRRVEGEAERMAALKPDYVFSNVAYLPLAAAKLAGIPCAAMCSLNWADIFTHYCGQMPGAAEMVQQMRDAYSAADTFLRVTPGMPMSDFSNLQTIGPIARFGQNHREVINRQLGIKPGEKLVLISLGGIATRLPMEYWPDINGVRWLVQADWNVTRNDTATLESLTIDFTDILASCDAFICKPGYGSFAEAACNGVPVLYVSRQDWPEEPCLTRWLAQHGQCIEIHRQALESGQLQMALATLWTQPRPASTSPSGIMEAADYLLRSISIASP
jgi:UDP:flavonoid glycosyltransferase YjiC (YdhE family)